MSNDNTLMELPDSEQVTHHLTVINNDAVEAMRELYNLLAHGDTEGARQMTIVLSEKVEALQQFGQQATSIIDGLVAAVNVAVGQRNEALAEQKELREEFQLAVSEAVSDIFSYDDSIDEQRVEWLADLIATNGFDEIAESQRADLEEQLQYAKELAEYDLMQSTDPLEDEADLDQD